MNVVGQNDVRERGKAKLKIGFIVAPRRAHVSSASTLGGNFADHGRMMAGFFSFSAKIIEKSVMKCVISIIRRHFNIANTEVKLRYHEGGKVSN